MQGNLNFVSNVEVLNNDDYLFTQEIEYNGQSLKVKTRKSKKQRKFKQENYD